MLKTKRTITRIEDNDEVYESVYDKYMSSTRKIMFRTIFALASAAKITPKQLAKSFSEGTDEYARKMNEALADRAAKQKVKEQKELDKKLKD